MSDLLRSGARGGAITLGAQAILFAISATSLLVLSRLLSPQDFGLVAMGVVVTGLSATFRDLGLFTSAVRARTLSNQQASNLFWINAGLGLLVASVVVAATPFVAAVYDAPELSTLLPVMSISVLLSGIQAQIQVHLIRDRRFGALAGTDVLAEALGLAAAIGGALSGWGYWALAAQILTAAAVRLIARAWAAHWLPALPKGNSDTKPLVVSGVHYAVAGFADYASKNIDTFVIGARWGASTVGLYSRSYQLMNAPVSQMISPLFNVVLPTLNEARNQGRSISAAMLRLQPVVTLPTTLVFAAAAASAHHLVPLVLGSQWSGAVTFFVILAVGGVARTFNQTSYWLFLLEGSSKAQMQASLVAKSIMVALVAVSSLLSAEAVAVAVVAGLALNWAINLLWLGQTTAIEVRPFVENALRIASTGVASALAVMWLPWSFSPLGLLGATLVQGSLAATVFLLLTASSRRGRADLRTVWRVLKSAF